MPRERTALAEWFWEIDRVLLSLIVVLIAIGLVAVAAASPVAAIDRSTSQVSVDPLVYFYRQLLWVGLGVPLMLGISMMQRDQARRLAIALGTVFLFALLLVPVLGSSVNGAKRWIELPGMRFQPSEFLKPAYVVTMAWLLSLRERGRGAACHSAHGGDHGRDRPALDAAAGFGQTVLFCACWGALLLLTGVSWRVIGVMTGAALGAIVAVYLFYENGRQRINDFLGLGILEDTGPDQVELAHRTITNGGFGGVGPGLGASRSSACPKRIRTIYSR